MRGWEIGRVGGVPLEVPPLFLLWSVFLWWTLSFLFPRSHIGFPELTYRYLALGATLLIIACALLHEAVMIALYRRIGCPLPQRLDLAPWGGAWKYRDPKPLAAEEIRAEIVATFFGPAIYMALSLSCLALGLVLQPHIPNFLPTRAVTDTVGIACATLAFLNLLPGYPFDAGRVIDALIRRSTGDRARALQASRFGGQMIALWCMVLGVGALAVSGTIWGFWGVVMGTAILESVQADSPEEHPGASAAGAQAGP